jgi:SAM-dependent methyltransferase
MRRHGSSLPSGGQSLSHRLERLPAIVVMRPGTGPAYADRMLSGCVGGELGYRLVRTIAGSPPRRHPCSGDSYRHRSKLEVLLGPDIWSRVAGKTVIDFGCGRGEHIVEIAQRGATRAIGYDIREHVLEAGRRLARDAGVADRCVFTTEPAEKADVVISMDAFEHFSDPAGVLRQMGALLKPGGTILTGFGPVWLHPYGGHSFSIFPWAHLVFSERAFMRWWSEFKSDGATRFTEIDGGLNGMTVGWFQRLVRESGYVVERFEPVPIRRTRPVHNRITREFLTSVVRCRLRTPVPVSPPLPGQTHERVA